MLRRQDRCAIAMPLPLFHALGFFSAALLALFALTVFLATGCGGPSAGKAGSQSAADSSGWSVIGPGGGGSMFEPTVSPFDPDFAFLRCDMTGAYVTHDGGESWKMFNLRSVVEDFEFDPADSSVAYATGSGLYRTTDRGESWELIYPAPAEILAERMVNDHATQWFVTATDSLPSFIHKVRVEPTDNTVLYLGRYSGVIYRDSLAALYLSDSCQVLVSRDRGASWREAGRVPGTRVLALLPGSWRGAPGELTVITDRAGAIIPLEGGAPEALALPAANLAAADGGRDSQGGHFCYILGGFEKAADGQFHGGVYRSADGGRSWQPANGDLLAECDPAAEHAPYFNTMSACEGDPRVLYLSNRGYPAADGKSHMGVLRSDDAGDHWRWVYRTDGDSLLTNNYRYSWHVRSYGWGWVGNPHGIGICPTNADIVYTTDYGRAARSDDGGVSWRQVYNTEQPDSANSTRGLDVTTCYGIHFDPFDPQHLFIAYTDIGLFESRDGGKGWFHCLNGIPVHWINTCYWVQFDPQVQGRLWSVWGNGHDLPRLKMFRSGKFVERFEGGVALSEDGGRSWTPAAGIPDKTVCTHIVLDPDSPAEARVLYACGVQRGVFKSVDGGKNWELKANGLPAEPAVWRLTRLPDGTLCLLVMRSLRDNRIVDGGIYLSRDGAESWQSAPLPAGVNAPNDLIVDPRDPQVMYLSCWPLPRERVERGGGLFRSEDGGATWRQVFREDAHVFGADLDPADPSIIVINTFDSAAFRSEDRGDTWRRIEGYSFKWGHRPVFDPHHPGMLYLMTFGGSVFHGPAKVSRAIRARSPTWTWAGAGAISSAPARPLSRKGISNAALRTFCQAGAGSGGAGPGGRGDRRGELPRGCGLQWQGRARGCDRPAADRDFQPGRPAGRL